MEGNKWKYIVIKFSYMWSYVMHPVDNDIKYLFIFC